MKCAVHAKITTTNIWQLHFWSVKCIQIRCQPNPVYACMSACCLLFSSVFEWVRIGHRMGIYVRKWMWPKIPFGIGLYVMYIYALHYFPPYSWLLDFFRVSPNWIGWKIDTIRHNRTVSTLTKININGQKYQCSSKLSTVSFRIDRFVRWMCGKDVENIGCIYLDGK